MHNTNTQKALNISHLLYLHLYYIRRKIPAGNRSITRPKQRQKFNNDKMVSLLVRSLSISRLGQVRSNHLRLSECKGSIMIQHNLLERNSSQSRSMEIMKRGLSSSVGGQNRIMLIFRKQKNALQYKVSLVVARHCMLVVHRALQLKNRNTQNLSRFIYGF